MIFWIGFILGTLGGCWATSWTLNHYYRTDVWSARKAVLLEQLLVQRKRYEIQRTKAEIEVDRLMDERRDEIREG